MKFLFYIKNLCNFQINNYYIYKNFFFQILKNKKILRNIFEKSKKKEKIFIKKYIIFQINSK